MLFKLISEFFRFRNFLWFVLALSKAKPDLVWIHQIGNDFPKTLPLVCKLMRLKSIQTHHDYGLVSMRKLYPQNLKLAAEQIQQMHLSFQELPEQLKLCWESSSRRIVRQLFVIRRSILIWISNMNVTNILISNQQASILRSAKLANIVVLPNSTEACNCVIPSGKAYSQTTFLFAGRPAGKGLDRICGIVSNTSNSLLLLAGKPELLSYIPRDFPSEKLHYLGNLSQTELFSIMHQVDFVAVLSECFDVYPSVLLEALEHGSRVLCSQTVGNMRLVGSQFQGFVIPSDFNFHTSSLQDVFSLTPDTSQLFYHETMWGEQELLMKVYELIEETIA